MTRRAAGRRRGVPRIWLLPTLIFTAILGLTAADLLSRSLVLDLVAWWPVWLLLAVVAVAAGRRRIGRVRIGGVVSIFVGAALVAFIVGHLNGWPINPSATRYLVGPQADPYAVAEMVAVIDGDLRIGVGSGFLYEVSPLPGGGSVGTPSATEQISEESISVSLEAPQVPGFDRSSGWDISLSGSPSWSLVLGGDVEADLTGIEVSSLDLTGVGHVTLGRVGENTLVEVDGAFVFRIPPEVPAQVTGTAQVPDSWTGTGDGWRSPAEGTGWIISVPPGSVVSVDQD